MLHIVLCESGIAATATAAKVYFSVPLSRHRIPQVILDVCELTEASLCLAAGYRSYR